MASGVELTRAPPAVAAPSAGELQPPPSISQLSPQHPLRRILPAGPPLAGNAALHAALHAASASRTKVPPKNIHVKGACDACRGRKIKCSGGRPKCTACQRSGAECNYIAGPTETHSQALKRKFEVLREEKTVYEELCNLIRKMPEKESAEIVRRLRASEDVSSIIRQVKTGCLLLQLALSPESRLRYSFPYVADMPSKLRSPDNPYVGSSIFEASYSSNPSPSPDQLSGQYKCVYMKPYHVAEVVDPRFSKIRASRWTAVTDDDNLFRNLLQAYILYEHTTYPYIHMDSFLDGMVSGDERFCSSLMVNAMMASACHCYRGIPDRHKFWKPQSLGYQFLAEARRLWELEIKLEEPSLTCAMAGLLLNIEFNHNGLDMLGNDFISQATTMAQHFGLFDLEVQKKIEDKKLRDVWEYFSWSLFSWLTVQAYYFFREPLVKTMPATPMPDPKQNPSWYGECWLLYPVSPAPIPAEHGHTIKSMTELHIILHNISCRAFHNGQSTRRLSWEEAMEFKQMLDNWFHTLPDVLSPKNVVFPWHLKMHTTYYAAVYTLFTSLVSRDALPSISSLSSSPPPSPTIDTTGSIATRAIMRLETVIRLYYLRHSFSFSDSFLVYYLSVLTRATLETMGDSDKPLLDPHQMETLRSTILLCMKGMNEQGQNNYISEVVYRVLKDSLSQQDLHALKTSVNLIEWNEDDMFIAKQCRSQWPLPGVKVYENPRAAGIDRSLDRLVKKCDRMTLEEDSRRRREESRKVVEIA